MGRRPNVVLIVVDTLREDHSGALDALLSMGFRKYCGVAPAPWTLPSHVSMFTGLYPSMHGAHEAYGVGALELAVPSRDAMRASGGGILGDLARDGYETHMYSANTIFVTPRYGFGPFDEVLLVPYFAPTALSSEEELEDFLSSSLPSPRSVARLLGRGELGRLWALSSRYLGVRLGLGLDKGSRIIIDRVRRGLPGFGEPFFLFVNLMEAHGPYGREVGEGEEILAALRQIYLGDDSLIRRRLPWKRRAYARSARFAVERVLELVGALGPRLEDSLVIVTSDHGEAIREDATHHTLYLYDELTRVPLYVRWPACLPAPPEGGGLVSLTKIRSIVSSASGCEASLMDGGIALSESFGTILAPDERRLGARVSPERLRWAFSHRVKVHTGRGSVTYNASQGIVEEVSGLGADEAARLAGEAVAWLAGGRGLVLLQRF